MNYLSKQSDGFTDKQLKGYLKQLYAEVLSIPADTKCFNDVNQTELSFSKVHIRYQQIVPLKIFSKKLSESQEQYSTTTIPDEFVGTNYLHPFQESQKKLELKKTSKTLKKSKLQQKQGIKQAFFQKTKLNTIDMEIYKQKGALPELSGKTDLKKTQKKLKDKNKQKKKKESDDNFEEDQIIYFKPDPQSILLRPQLQQEYIGTGILGLPKDKSQENLKNPNYTLLQNINYSENEESFDLDAIEASSQTTYSKFDYKIIESDNESEFDQQESQSQQNIQFPIIHQNNEYQIKKEVLNVNPQIQNFHGPFMQGMTIQQQQEQRGPQAIIQQPYIPFDQNLYYNQQYGCNQQYQNQLINLQQPQFDIQYYFIEQQDQHINQSVQQGQQHESNARSQLRNFRRQKREKKKQKKEKTIIFTHKKEILIVLFHSGQFQINNCLGQFKKPQNYTATKKNQDKDTEQIYFECVFQFPNNLVKNQYWEGQIQQYENVSQKNRLICLFMRRGEYILKAILDGRTFYRDDKQNFDKLSGGFDKPQNQSYIKTYKFEDYILKLFTEDTKFQLKKIKDGLVLKEYIGFYKIQPNNDKHVPKIIREKLGTKYATKCMYQKFREDEYTYYVSHVDYFHFVILYKSQRMFFSSPFLQGYGIKAANSN